jgi:hypothetical protein
MSFSSAPASFSSRSLSVLRSVGGWMTIAPEQTYVATSIRGLGTCKSTYCKPERRELPARGTAPRGRLAALLAVAVAASGLLSGFASQTAASARDVAKPDQFGPGLEDCQKSAAPVSPGVAAGDNAKATGDCSVGPAVAALGTWGASVIAGVESEAVIARADTAGQVGFAGG